MYDLCFNEYVFGDVWVTEAKNKDTGREMLKLIITEYEQVLLWGKSVQKKYQVRLKGGLGSYITPEI